MKRTSYIISNQTAIGVEFEGARGIYFWLPDVDRLYQWCGSGWQQIAVSTLGGKRRKLLLAVWAGAPVPNPA